MIPESKPTLCLLGKIAEITKLAGFEYTKHFDYKVGGEIIALRSLNIRNGQLDLTEVHTIPREVSDALPRSKLKSGDIVLGYVGSKLGNLALIEEDDRFHLAPNVALIRPRDGVDPHYLLMFMQAPFYQNQLWALASSTGQPALSMANIRKSKISLPSNRDQKTIASIVANWDRAIETVEALIANARAQKQALMQQLLPQGTTPPKKRLPGFSGEWREAEFNEVFSLKIGGTPARKNPAYWDGDKATQNRWVAISDLQGKYIDETQEHISDEGVQNSNVKALAAGTVIFSFKLSIGRKAILRKSAYTNEAICALIPKRREELSSLFVFHALELVDFTASTDQAVKGATLNKAKIADLYLSFPPRAEQDRLVEVLEDADSEIANLQSQLSALRQEKAALMQQLLTGKRRVKFPESEVTHA